MDQPEWRAASQKDDTHDALLDILLGIPSILELSDQICYSMSTLCDAALAKQRLITRHCRIENQLRNWYHRLQSHGSEDLFLIEQRVAIGQSLLEGNPELVGTFSGSVRFLNGYIFELVLLYWFGSLLLYTSMARAYKQLQLSMGDSSPNNMITDRLNTLKEVEAVADSLAEKVCQTIEFCERPSVGAPGFQIVLPPLWAAQQFYDGRSSQKFRWCQMVVKALEKKGFLSGSVIASCSHQKYADIAESVQNTKSNLPSATFITP